MGIVQTTTVTCDDCKTTLAEGMDFFYFQAQVIGTVPPPFGNLLAFCDVSCLQKWSAALPTGA